MSKTIFFSDADGPTLTAAAAASLLPTNLPSSLPSGYWQRGRIWHIRASGRISCVVTTPGTARFDVRMGGTVVWDTGAIPLNIVAKTNVGWVLDVYLTCRAAGSGTTTTFLGQGFWLSEAALNTAVPSTGPGPGGNTLPYNTAPVVGTGVNNQSSLAWDLFHTQTVATGSLTCHQVLVEEMN